MSSKDIMYMILGATTLVGNIVALIWAFSWMKFQLQEMAKTQAKMMSILYPDEDGRLQFQSVNRCNSCRLACREEICNFVKGEMREQRDTIKRIHNRLDGIEDWLREKERK